MSIGKTRQSTKLHSPTALGATGSAVAVHIVSRRWLFLRLGVAKHIP